jgi:hypothetical protein
LIVQLKKEAIEAYKRVSATDEFKELERLRERTLHDEASALHYIDSYQAKCYHHSEN